MAWELVEDCMKYCHSEMVLSGQPNLTNRPGFCWLTDYLDVPELTLKSKLVSPVVRLHFQNP